MATVGVKGLTTVHQRQRTSNMSWIHSHVMLLTLIGILICTCMPNLRR